MTACVFMAAMRLQYVSDTLRAVLCHGVFVSWAHFCAHVAACIVDKYMHA